MSAERNLILITFDGIRKKEFFDRSLFSYFWNEMAEQGRVFGKQWPMQASHPSLSSLPCYQTILGGEVVDGDDNDIGQIRTETFLERISERFDLAETQVALIASWEKLAQAGSSGRRRIHVDCGVDPLSIEQKSDLPPWNECRWDKFTMKIGLNYLRKYRPKLLYLSFADSDDWGHEKNFEGYQTAIRQYDEFLRELRKTLESLGEYGQSTSVLMTTDHGRGEGELWHDHCSQTPEAKDIWLYCSSADSAFFADNRSYSHLDIRPQIEKFFHRS